MRSSHDPLHLGSVTPSHVIAVSGFIAVLVTVLSISELQTVISKADQLEHSSVSSTTSSSTSRSGGSSSSSGSTTTAASGSSSSSAASGPTEDLSKLKKECNAQANTEYWGDVVKWGSTNLLDSAAACCESCLNFKPDKEGGDKCNVWVYCADKALCGGQYKECWLKHLVHPGAAKPAREGEGVGWTAGICGSQGAVADVNPSGVTEPRKYHIVTSAQGSAVHWQTRVHYYWYKKRKTECEAQPNCEMGGFTRLLHSGIADDLMDEIPTFLAQPLPESVVPHSWYPVLNRPYAFVQWVEQANIKEKYVLMSEPDHIFLRPLPNFMRHDHPAAFPFFYIEPTKDEYLPMVARHLGLPSLTKKEAEDIAPIGNSPTFLTMDQMRRAMPLWHNMSVAIFKDQETNKQWGWVQEMYAFTLALYKIGVRKVELALNMMSQPPWDSKMDLSPGRPYYILHYTYGNDYTIDGKFTPGKYGEWRFDKRTYAALPPPRHLGEPPAGMKNDLVRALISSINEASANIECWDEYYKTGKLTPCSEKLPNSVYYKKFND